MTKWREGFFCTWRQERSRQTTLAHRRQAQNKDPILFLFRPRFTFHHPPSKRESPNDFPDRRGPIDTAIRNCPQPHIKLSRLPPSSPRVMAIGDSLIGQQKSGGSIQWQQGRRPAGPRSSCPSHTHTHRRGTSCTVGRTKTLFNNHGPINNPTLFG